MQSANEIAGVAGWGASNFNDFRKWALNPLAFSPKAGEDTGFKVEQNIERSRVDLGPVERDKVKS